MKNFLKLWGREGVPREWSIIPAWNDWWGAQGGLDTPGATGNLEKGQKKNPKRVQDERKSCWEHS